MDFQEKKRKRESKFTDGPYTPTNNSTLSGNSENQPEETKVPVVANERDQKLKHQDELKVLYRSYIKIKKSKSLSAEDRNLSVGFECRLEFLSVVEAMKGEFSI